MTCSSILREDLSKGKRYASERRGFWPEARTVRKKRLETTRTIDL